MMTRLMMGCALGAMLALTACGETNKIPNPFESGSSSSGSSAPTTAAASAAPAATPAPTASASDAKPGGDTATAAPTAVADSGASDSKPSGNASGHCTDGRDRRVVVINNTSTVMRELYGSDVRHDSWEEDVLGTNVLGAGQRINVNFDDGNCGCSFDLKAVFADNTETVRRDFNICREATWTITE